MPEERITWTPANGINVEDPSIRVRQDQCVEARNMLFERGVARTRPYAVKHHFGMWPNPSPAKWRFARGMLVGADNPNSVVVLTDGTLAKGPQAQTLSQSGGGTLALGSLEFDNINVVNGVFVIGNNGLNGMVRHDPTTSDFTIVTGAPFRYFTSLYSRAIGASGSLGNIVGFSVAGDETDWAGAGSGTTVLTETPDEITGLRTIQNVVIVIRSMGITAGFATGDGTNPIRWETVIRDGAEGCPYPSTVGSHGNHIFYCGHDDVYHLDMNLNPQGIGTAMRREILYWLARGVLFRGFVVRMDYGLPSGGRQFIAGNEMSDPKPRMRYHLVPIQNKNVPHYSYDIVGRTWGRHVYEHQFIGGLEGFNVAGSSAVSAVTWNTMLLLDDVTDHMVRWADGASGAGETADHGAAIRSGVFVVGDPTHEYKVQRAHLVWARDGSHGSGDPNPAGVILRVRCKQQHRYVEREASPLDAFQVAESSEGWQGTWVDLDSGPTGQFFQIALEIPPGFPMQIAQVELFLSDAGESKAGMYKQAA